MFTWGALSVPAQNNFPLCEGIRLDVDVRTTEDERLEAIKQSILRKLSARKDTRAFRLKPTGRS